MMNIKEFQKLYKDSRDINGVVANMSSANFFFDRDLCIIRGTWSTNKNGKLSVMELHLSLNDPTGSFYYKGWDRITKHKLSYNVPGGNTRIVLFNSSIAIETLVKIAHELCNGIVHDNYVGLCADVLDGSGTARAREKYDLKFNIHPDNLELITHVENSRRGGYTKHMLAQA